MTLRAAALVAAALVPFAVAGCGGGDGGGAATMPQGFRETKAADFSLAVPSDWKVEKLVSDSKGETIQARPPGTDVNRAQLRVGSARDYGSDINAAVTLTEGEIPVRRPGATRVASKPIDVRGAQDARRIEWTVPAGGGLGPARIVTVLALSKDRTLVNLSVGVAQDQAAEVRIDDVVRSLQVGS
jgi:hypothetical protein